ncbi:MAG: hypothetical protein Q4E65_06355 [Clostridia bacterium]|nr:hypothetical protein [Clostridia bacterium]
MMKTKTYYSKELSTALDQIKNELGADAAIVRSRKTRQPGIKGWFTKPVYEIVVSYDPDDLPQEKGKGSAWKPYPPKPVQPPVPLMGRTVTPKADTPAAASAQKAEASAPAAPEAAPVQAEAAIEEPKQLTEEELELAKLLLVGSTNPKEARRANKLRATPDEAIAQSRVSAYQIVQTMASNTVQDIPEPLPPAYPVILSQDEPETEIEPAPMPEPPPAKKKEKATEKAPEKPVAPAPAPEKAASPEMDARLSTMEEMLKALAADMRKMSQAEAEEEAEQEAFVEDANPSMEAMRLRLLEQDVDAAAVGELVSRAEARMAKDEKLSAGAAMRLAIRELLGRPKYLQSSPKGTRVIMLMGPTGVGKTTTVAKLAAECTFNRHAKVGIINADVFRVGAQEQLETYANILGASFCTIHNTEELRQAIETFSDCRYIFVDTGGRASMDKKYQEELSGMINLGVLHEIYLVTSSTTSARICKQIAQNYSFAKKYKNIITKVDEAGSYGNAITLCYYNKQPLAYFTIGQNVPEDIRRADLDVVIDMLLRISR